VVAVSLKKKGADVVLGTMDGALISAVNYSEVLKKAIERCQMIAPIAALMHSYSVEIVPFDATLAAISAELFPETKQHGLSFADRACLSLGIQRRFKVLTSERRMGLVTLPIKVRLIRTAH